MFGRRTPAPAAPPVDVSVVILSHREGMLPEAYASAMAQTHKSREVLVRHATPTWASKLNAIVAAAAGEWVVVLCDDDVLDPTFLARCLECAVHADVVYTDRRVFTSGMAPEDGLVCRYHPSQPAGGIYGAVLDYGSFVFGSSLPMTCMIRRSLWEELKGYDDVPHADSELLFRAVQRGARMVYVAEPLFGYRVHADQLSLRVNSQADALRAFHKKHFRTFGITVGAVADVDGNFACTVRPPLRKRLAAWLMRVIAWAATPSLTTEQHHVRS